MTVRKQLTRRRNPKGLLLPIDDLARELLRGWCCGNDKRLIQIQETERTQSHMNRHIPEAVCQHAKQSILGEKKTT